MRKSISHKDIHKSMTGRMNRVGLVSSGLVITEARGQVLSSAAGSAPALEETILAAMRSNAFLAARIKNAVTRMEVIRAENMKNLAPTATVTAEIVKPTWYEHILPALKKQLGIRPKL